MPSNKQLLSILKRSSFNNQTGEPKYLINTKNLKKNFEKLKAFLIDFEKDVNNILDDLINYENLTHVKFLEILNNIQLSTELQISKLKFEEGFDLNDDELLFSPECSQKINMVNNRNMRLIERVELIQKEIVYIFKSNEVKRIDAEKELNSIKSLINKWNKQLQKVDKIDQFSFNFAEKQFKKFDFYQLRSKTDELILSEFEISFIPYKKSKFSIQVINEFELGHIKTNKVEYFKISNIIDKKNLNNEFNFIKNISNKEKNNFKLHQIRCLTKDKYLLMIRHNYKALSPQYLSVYNDENKISENKISCLIQFDFDPDVDILMNTTEKIAIHSRFDQKITIFGIDLNIIKIIKLLGTTKLVGIDKNFIYCINEKIEIISYDFLLFMKKTKLQFNLNDELSPFFIPDNIGFFGFVFFELMDELLIIKIININSIKGNSSFVFYNKNGNVIKVSKSSNTSYSGFIQIDSKDDLIISYSYVKNHIEYQNLKGELLQQDIGLVSK